LRAEHVDHATDDDRARRHPSGAQLGRVSLSTWVVAFGSRQTVPRRVVETEQVVVEVPVDVSCGESPGIGVDLD
jgi:hypothetical protein